MQAASGPTDGPPAGVGQHLPVVGQSHDVVQDHGNIASQLALDVDGPLRRELPPFSVDVRAKLGSLLVDRDPVSEAEDLETAAVGQERTVPAHEVVQSSQLLNHLGPGAEGQVVGIGQDQLSAAGGQLSGGEAFDGALRADRHEGRHLHHASRRGQGAAPSVTQPVKLLDAKSKTAGGHRSFSRPAA